MAPTKPRAAVGLGARMPMPKVNVSKQTSSGKRGASTPKLKTMSDLRKPSPKPPKQPKVPALFSPLGGGTGEENPSVTPANSQKGAKQKVGIKNPFSAL